MRASIAPDSPLTAGRRHKPQGLGHAAPKVVSVDVGGQTAGGASLQDQLLARGCSFREKGRVKVLL